MRGEEFAGPRIHPGVQGAEEGMATDVIQTRVVTRIVVT
jgi:hypothetical protein